jgi:hypothetical protein
MNGSYNNYNNNKTHRNATAIKSMFMIAAALLVLIMASVISIPSTLAASSSSFYRIIPVRHAKCPMGTTHNYTTMTCQASLSCPTGTSFNQASGKCEATAQPRCLVPGQYNSANNRCEATPRPITGGDGLGECPVTYPTNSGGVCITSSGFSPCPADKCESQAIQCASEFIYNSAAKQCQRSEPPLCPTGTTLNQASGRCQGEPICPSGYVLDQSRIICRRVQGGI